MKIVIASLYNGQVARGVESWAIQMLEHVSSSDYELILIQGGTQIPDINLPYQRVIVESTPADDISGDTSALEKIYANVKRFYKAIEPHLISIQPDILIPANGGGLLLLRNIIFQNQLNTKIVYVGQAEIPMDIMYADAFVALSAREYMLAKQHLSIPVYLNHNGVEITDFSKFDEGAHLFPELAHLPRPIVLCVSALVAYKRVINAIMAMNHLGVGSLVIVGDGRMKEQLENYIQEHVPESRQNHFIFFNHIPHQKMPYFYKNADVFVHPAHEIETFGIVIIEALAAGLPVVINDDPVRREIAGEVGFYTNPDNIPLFAGAISEAFWSKGSHQDERQAQAQLFSWQKVAEDYRKIFDQIVM